jgi:hypothetical protein
MRTLIICWYLQPPAYDDINPPWVQTPSILTRRSLSACGALATLVLQASLHPNSTHFIQEWLMNLRGALDRCEDAFLAMLQQTRARRILVAPYNGPLGSFIYEEHGIILKKMLPRLQEQGLLRIFRGDEPEWNKIYGECYKCCAIDFASDHSLCR